MPAILICGDTLRSPELRHEVPLGIGDPFLYLETDGRRAVLTNVLEVDRIAQQAPDARAPARRAVRPRRADRRKGCPTSRSIASCTLRAARELGIAAAMVPPDFPLAVADRLRAEGIELTARRRALRRAPAPQDRCRAGRHPPRRARRRGGRGGVRRACCARPRSTATGCATEGEVLTSEAPARAHPRGVRAPGRARRPTTSSWRPCAPATPSATRPAAGRCPRTPDLPRPVAAGRGLGLLGRHDAHVGARRHHRRGGRSAPARARGPRALARGHAARRARASTLYGAACDVFEAAGHPTQRTKKPGETLQHGFYFGLGHGVGLEVHEAPAARPHRSGAARSPATSSPSSRARSIPSTAACASRTWCSSPRRLSCSPNGRTISALARRMADPRRNLGGGPRRALLAPAPRCAVDRLPTRARAAMRSERVVLVTDDGYECPPNGHTISRRSEARMRRRAACHAERRERTGALGRGSKLVALLGVQGAAGSAPCSRAFPTRSGFSGRCETPTGGSSTSRSATATARSCGRSGSRPRRGTATRCWRRCRGCAAAAPSTPTSGCASRASRGSRRSRTTRRSATATCSGRSCTARPSSATG